MIKQLSKLFRKEITYSYSERNEEKLHTNEIIGFSCDLIYVFFVAKPSKHEPSSLSYYTKYIDVLHNEDDESIHVTKTYVTGLTVIDGDAMEDFKAIQRKLFEQEARELIRTRDNLLEKVKEYNKYIVCITEQCKSREVQGAVIDGEIVNTDNN